mgnify:CR=1 FL=1
MKIKDIRNMSIGDLTQKSESLVEELFKLRFRHAAGQLDSPAIMKSIRRDVARVKTVLREKGGSE